MLDIEIKPVAGGFRFVLVYSLWHNWHNWRSHKTFISYSSLEFPESAFDGSARKFSNSPLMRKRYL